MTIEIQIASQLDNIPQKQEFQHWAKAAIQKKMSSMEICIRIVDEQEMITLNEQYRKKQGPTNVLSFDYREKNHPSDTIFGDIIICSQVVEKEAKEQETNRIYHWAHMVIHGCLHLQGYDHQTDEETEEMEQIEKNALQHLFN